MLSETLDLIFKEETSYVITFYCSINVRNHLQQAQAMEYLSHASSLNSHISKPGRRKSSDAHIRLLKITNHKKKLKTQDRSGLLNGSKDSVIKFFQTRLGRLVYYQPFCHLWEDYVKQGQLSEELAENFNSYLNSIKRAVTGLPLE